ncbi:MAG: tRNA uridine-5-carboxymethylaminomethyl(34) synthesis enzyme MnmG [Candidatus Omnitrophica bacterium]|nr:tRNA uridine-5-carboxymethylaminomethyl(34) synthesis enzyme MnmG [Candidatus Omnitrophota bacterium]
MKKYDCIVIGAGHAGIEAAWSTANLGLKVLLLTIELDNIGKLSCNPAIGGIAKGHLVREVDALGGLMARIADRAALSYRILNRSKGKAVWATRAQVDKDLYPRIAATYLINNPNIEIVQAEVSGFVVDNKKIEGVITNFGQTIYAKTVIVCAGTFLKSTIHIGLDHFSGGRLYEISADALGESIKALGIKFFHFKTGTCARLDRRTIDYSKMEVQKPEFDVMPFSSYTKKIRGTGENCYITYTNKKTHNIILKNLDRSPLYTGKIKSTGVRYCPSLEDKLVRFRDKTRHQVFIEPEGANSLEIYPNGLSTSLPYDIQERFIRTVPGLEKVKILRPGYGIEHGVIDARELTYGLESKNIPGLFFAGQVNGTTGYEEAAAQGLVAGINAALKVKHKKPVIFPRTESFIGVLIDDLVNKGVNEPYRMFTSRSEFRLSIRESNADIRLADKAYLLGLIDSVKYDRVMKKAAAIKREIKKLSVFKININNKKISAMDYIKRPNVTYDEVIEKCGFKKSSCQRAREVEIMIKYEGFIKREDIWTKELKNLHRIKIPKMDYKKVPSLSNEVVGLLFKYKPDTLGDALNISGITPSAIVNIYRFINKNRKKNVRHSAKGGSV